MRMDEMAIFVLIFNRNERMMPKSPQDCESCNGEREPFFGYREAVWVKPVKVSAKWKVAGVSFL